MRIRIIAAVLAASLSSTAGTVAHAETYTYARHPKHILGFQFGLVLVAYPDRTFDWYLCDLSAWV